MGRRRYQWVNPWVGGYRLYGGKEVVDLGQSQEKGVPEFLPLLEMIV